MNEREVNIGKENISEEARIAVRGYYKGFEVLIEKRNFEGKVDFEGITKGVDNMLNTGFTSLPEKSLDAPETPKELPAQEEKKEQEIPICPYHNKPMTLKTGKYGDFWNCGTKLDNGEWCKWRPKKKKE